ncbi:hypothetical protein [Streptomyces sp. NPDC048611]|uniref:hypothetical protein n=1 Tax=Streptomyces sp. NPDC048611 TaxID=3155635 RepID=UPI00341F6B9E
MQLAFRAALVTVFLQVGGWALEAFVLPPTGFRQLRDQVGLSGALIQLTLSAGGLVVLAGGWLLCAVRMRRGHNWARLVLVTVAGLHLLFVLTDLSTNGLPTEWTVLSRYGPDLFTSAIAPALLLPASRAYFSAVKRAG